MECFCDLLDIKLTEFFYCYILLASTPFGISFYVGNVVRQNKTFTDFDFAFPMGISITLKKCTFYSEAELQSVISNSCCNFDFKLIKRWLKMLCVVQKNFLSRKLDHRIQILVRFPFVRTGRLERASFFWPKISPCDHARGNWVYFAQSEWGLATTN